MSTNGNNLTGRGTMTWETIPPETAAEWLALNTGGNRKLKPTAIVQYGNAMIAGLWREADAPITRRADGVLMDGANRLYAVVETGVTIHAWVHTVSEDVEVKDLRLDLGRNRTVADITGIDKNATAVARTLITIGSGKAAMPISVDDVVRVVGIVSPEFNRLTTVTRRGVSTSGARAATCYAMHAYPADVESIVAQYDAMVLGNFGYPFWPAVTSAMRQVMELSGGGHMFRINAFLRFSRAWSPQSRGASRVAFRDISAALTDISPKVAAYIGLA